MRSIARTIIALALALAQQAHAQVYQCPSSAGPVFQQSPCGADSSGLRATKRDASGNAAAACPSVQKITAFESSMGKVGLHSADRVAERVLLKAMKQCPKSVTCADFKAIADSTDVAHDAAQRFLPLARDHGVSPERLDGDGDGVACEAFRRVGKR